MTTRRSSPSRTRSRRWATPSVSPSTFTGDADWEANINTQVQGGNPPDIAFFPQPGKLADFAADGSIVPLTAEVDATVDEYWAAGLQLFGESTACSTAFR